MPSLGLPQELSILYQFCEKVSEDAVSVVYRALQPEVGKQVAVRVTSCNPVGHEAAVRGFLEEVRHLNRIRHPNLVEVLGFGQLPDASCYIIRDWVEGETLAMRLSKRRLRRREAVELLGQICDGLEFCHGHGVAHGDLHPGNIFLIPLPSGSDFVRLVDVGVAKLITGEGPYTVPNAVVGAPAYASPEHLRGLSVGPETDVYALGVIAFEMLLGRRPFEADAAIELYRMHMSELPPSARSVWPAVPAQLDRLLAGMLDKDAKKRPGVQEVRDQILEHGAALPDEIPGEPEPEVSAGRPKSNPFAVVGLTRVLPPDHDSRPRRAPSLRPAASETSGRRDSDITRRGLLSERSHGAPDRAASGSGSGRIPASMRGAPDVRPSATAPTELACIAENADRALARPPAGRGRLALVVAVSLLGLGALIAVWALYQRVAAQGAPAAPGVAATAPSTQPAVIQVTVNVSARIWLDHQVVARSARQARIETREPGVHDLMVVAAGYRPVKREVSLQAGQHITVDVALEPSGD